MALKSFYFVYSNAWTAGLNYKLINAKNLRDAKKKWRNMCEDGVVSADAGVYDNIKIKVGKEWRVVE